MRNVFFIIVLSAITKIAWSQTCTMTATGTVQWTSAAAIACSPSGNMGSGYTTLVIPSGTTLVFGNGDDWIAGIAGLKIEINGELQATGNGTGNRIDASIDVKSGGKLTITSKLNLGLNATTPASCNFTLVIRNGGTTDVGGTASDRLDICGTPIFKGAAGGSCNNCTPYVVGGTTYYNCDGISPIYCEPASGGFTGPLGFDKTGSKSSLPIELLYFRAYLNKEEKHVEVEWATEDEENFSHFVIERAGRDLKFSPLAEVPGAGYNTNSVKKYSTIDENPLVGIGYYRLKAVDIDGSYEYFSVKSVEYNGNKRMLVSPNPASGNGFTYTINFDPGPYDRVTLINQVGTELYSAPVTGTENEFIPDVSLRPGAYLLRYTSPDFTEVARVFIKK